MYRVLSIEGQNLRTDVGFHRALRENSDKSSAKHFEELSTFSHDSDLPTYTVTAAPGEVQGLQQGQDSTASAVVAVAVATNPLAPVVNAAPASQAF